MPRVRGSTLHSKTIFRTFAENNNRQMLQFVCFGSGSSGNCYYLFDETGGIMIDAGVGIRSLRKHFADYGIDKTMLKAILVTHDHADHIKSVGVISADTEAPVYSTYAVHHGIEQNYCVRKKIKAGYGRYIKHGDTFDIGAFHVTCFPVPHDSSDNLGYRIIYRDTVFCIITDAGKVTDEMKQHISQAHYLVIESNYELEKLQSGPYPQYLKDRITSGFGHLSNVQCGEAIAENASPRLKHVWLAHLSEENNHPELARKTVESVLRSYGIVAGKDFTLDVLKRKTPSEIVTLC